MPVSTENGWDHLINHEAQFSGLAWGLAPTTNAPFWRRYLRERYNPSTWEVFPLAQYLSHDKVAFIYNNLSAAVHNHEVMAWTLGLGYNTTYRLQATGPGQRVSIRQWLLWVDRVQKSVIARYVGQGASTPSTHSWGTNALNPDNGVIDGKLRPGQRGRQPLAPAPHHERLEPARLRLPFRPRPASWPGTSFAPGDDQRRKPLSRRRNGATNVRFWIYSTGGRRTRASSCPPATVAPPPCRWKPMPPPPPP
jgi:hypothetical protein